jgi:hypothetical protein
MQGPYLRLGVNLKYGQTSRIVGAAYAAALLFLDAQVRLLALAAVARSAARSHRFSAATSPHEPPAELLRRTLGVELTCVRVSIA